TIGQDVAPTDPTPTGPPAAGTSIDLAPFVSITLAPDSYYIAGFPGSTLARFKFTVTNDSPRPFLLNMRGNAMSAVDTAGRRLALEYSPTGAYRETGLVQRNVRP